MDLCSLDDAFPNIGIGSIHKKGAGGSGPPFVGCTDNKPTREERRAARKRAKRCKGQVASAPEGFASTDPDRPAIKRLDPVEAINGGQARLYSPPVGQQPLIIPPKSTSLLAPCNDDTPAYFGRGEEDPVEEGEGFSDFAQTSGDDPTYRLVPDFTKVFDFKGLEKAAGGAGTKPPELNDQWKPMEAGATYTAFFTSPKVFPSSPEVQDWSADSLRGEEAEAEEKAYLERWEKPAAGAALKRYDGTPVPNDLGLPPVPSTPPVMSAGAKEREAMLARIDGLMNRLDALEKRHKGNNQNELLLFIGTGLFLLASFNLAARC